MLRLGAYLFRLAATEADMDAVHRLNHETFVREIPQHHDPGSDRLVDKFHDKNAYLIAIRGDDLVGMVAVHDRPPFSIVDRLADPGVLERPGERPLEVRLLAVRPEFRHGPVFAGLLWSVHEHARRSGRDSVLISGVSERVPLYERLGFRPLGPAVPCGRAAFVPMRLDLGEPPDDLRRTIDRWRARLGRRTEASPRRLLSLMPGPVNLSHAVRSAWTDRPISHRGPGFNRTFEQVRGQLSGLVGGRSDVALFCGSGTLANDVIAATLAAERRGGDGLILVNGEFGSRLARQAARFGLKFRTLRQRWGKPWDLEAVRATLRADGSIRWAWGVHLESSTGVLNDLEGLKCVVSEAGVQLCLDAVSSLGSVPLDLAGVHLASGSSGKGLGALSGLAIVFAAPGSCAFLDARRIPSYLDLQATLERRGPRFTFPSGLILSLDRALVDYATPEQRADRFGRYAELGRFIRASLRALGLRPVAEDAWAAPVITSFSPPRGSSPDQFAADCLRLGYELGHASAYLRRRGWVQIATMGEIGVNDVRPLFAELASI